MMSHGNSPSVFYYHIISWDGCDPRECWGPLTPFPRVPLRPTGSLVASALLCCSARSQFSPLVGTSSGLMPIFLKCRASGWRNGGDPGTPALAGREEASPAAASPWWCCAGSARVPLSSLPSHLGKGFFFCPGAPPGPAQSCLLGVFESCRGAGAAPVSSAAMLLAPPGFSFPASWCVLCPPSRFGAREAFLGPAMSHPGLVMLPVPSQGSRSVLSLLSTPPAHRGASLSLRILPCLGVPCHILLHETVSLCHHPLI